MLRAQLLNSHDGQAVVAAKGVQGAVHVRVLPMTYEDYVRAEQSYREGALIQKAFFLLDEPDREFIKTGTTPQSWYDAFGRLDEEGHEEASLRDDGPKFLTQAQYQKVYAGELDLKSAYAYNARQIENRLAEKAPGLGA